MKKRALASFSKKFTFLLSILACLYQSVAYPTFAEYCQQFDKAYTDQEYERRREIYEDRIAKFQNITQYTPGINNKTDWTHEEIQALSTVNTLPQLEIQSSSMLQTINPRLGAPSSLDWRSKGMITPIKDQGSCGACWAFAAVAAAESLLIKLGKQSQWTIDLSEQKVLQCTRSSDCDGGYMENAIVSVQKCPKESQYPYSPYYSYRGICNSGQEIGTEVKDYYAISDRQMIQLLQQGPVAITISATGWENYGSGVFSCSSYDPINHAVQLVGYTSSYWIVKNQWGTDFGINGYIYINRNSYRNCGIGVSAHVIKWEAHILKQFLLISLALISLALLS